MVKLESLLEKIKDTPLDLNYIRTKLPPKCRAVEYKTLKNKHRSEVFKDTEALIVLVPKKDSNVGHFITLVPKEHHIEYFSSLAGSPEQELNKLGQNSKILMKLLGKNYIYNSKPLQSSKNSIEVCALWCLCRIKLHELTLSEFQTLFSRNVHLSNPDDLVSLMTFLLVADL